MDRRSVAQLFISYMAAQILPNNYAHGEIINKKFPDYTGNPTLLQLYKHPVLMQEIYRYWPGGHFSNSGAAGLNRSKMSLIEEQRSGGEYVLAGVLSKKEEWRKAGWRVIDWGISQQMASGAYKGNYHNIGGQYHSTSLFIHSLEIACMADPLSATKQRLECLKKSIDWMIKNKDQALFFNRDYTHRLFISMSVIGRAAFITRQDWLYKYAFEWAQIGLAAQLENGVNPERGGFDISYQLVGPLHSLLFMPICPDKELIYKLKDMCRKAISIWKTHLHPDGSIVANTSTRIGVETNLSGKAIKSMDYKGALKALVLASVELKDDELIDVALLFWREMKDAQNNKNKQ